MAIGRAGVKQVATQAIDLTGCPDPLEDLLAARYWVMENILHVTLRAWQREVFEELGRNERPRLAYIQIPRKNGKSFLFAVYILTEMILLPGRQLYAVSDSKENLTSVLFLEIQTLIYNNQLEGNLVPYSSKIENADNQSFIQLRASNFGASQGINPHAIFFDEVHLQTTDRIWNGMQLSGAARRNSADGPGAILLGTSTPGYDLVSLCHDVYSKVKAGKMYGKIYEPDEERGEFDYADEEVWAEANPCMADDPEFIVAMREDFDTMPEHEFRRFRLGQWTASAGAWLPYGAYDACLSTEELDPTARCWVGFDGSYSGDASALIAVNELMQVRVLGIWENPNPNDRDWRVPREEVDAAVHWAFANLNVERLLADPYYWQSEILAWSRTYRGRVLEFPTGSQQRMVPACTALYTAIIEKRLQHNGNQLLAKHLANARVRDTEFGTTIVKDKRWSPAKIDGAIALALAVWGASKASAPRSPAGAR